MACEWANYVNEDVRWIAQILEHLDKGEYGDWKFRMTNGGKLCVYNDAHVYIVRVDHGARTHPLVDNVIWTVCREDRNEDFSDWKSAILSIVNPTTVSAAPGDE